MERRRRKKKGDKHVQMLHFVSCLSRWSGPNVPCQVAKPCAKEASTNHLSVEKLYQDQLAQINTEFLLAALPPRPRNIPMGNNPMGPPDALDP